MNLSAFETSFRSGARSSWRGRASLASDRCGLNSSNGYNFTNRGASDALRAGSLQLNTVFVDAPLRRRRRRSEALGRNKRGWARCSTPSRSGGARLRMVSGRDSSAVSSRANDSRTSQSVTCVAGTPLRRGFTESTDFGNDNLDRFREARTSGPGRNTRGRSANGPSTASIAARTTGSAEAIDELRSRPALLRGRTKGILPGSHAHSLTGMRRGVAREERGEALGMSVTAQDTPGSRRTRSISAARTCAHRATRRTSRQAAKFARSANVRVGNPLGTTGAMTFSGSGADFHAEHELLGDFFRL